MIVGESRAAFLWPHFDGFETLQPCWQYRDQTWTHNRGRISTSIGCAACAAATPRWRSSGAWPGTGWATLATTGSVAMAYGNCAWTWSRAIGSDTYGERLVLPILCAAAGDKRTQDADIDRAVDYWRDWQARHATSLLGCTPAPQAKARKQLRRSEPLRGLIVRQAGLPDRCMAVIRPLNKNGQGLENRFA